MKKMMMVFLMVFSANALAAGAKEVWDCEGTSDPDYMNARVYEVKGHHYARLTQYFGDGDGYALDIVEVKIRGDENDGIVTYEQVENPTVKIPRLPESPNATGKTKGLVLLMPYEGGESTLTFKIAPNGDAPSSSDFSESLDCRLN